MITGRHMTTVAAANTPARTRETAQPRSRTNRISTTTRIGASHTAPPPLNTAISAELMIASGTSGRGESHSRIANAAIPAIEITSAAAAISLIPPHR